MGVFVEGDTPEGIADMGGNMYEWTSSLWGSVEQLAPTFTDPYDDADGREDPAAPAFPQPRCWHSSWPSAPP